MTELAQVATPAHPHNRASREVAKERRRHLANRFAGGASYEELQAEFGVKRRRLRQMLQQAVVDRRAGRPSSVPVGERVSLVKADAQ